MKVGWSLNWVVNSKQWRITVINPLLLRLRMRFRLIMINLLDASGTFCSTDDCRWEHLDMRL